MHFFYNNCGNLASIYCYKDGVQYIYYVATNMQGDVLGIYNYQGTLKASYEYDTWGNVISTTDTSTVSIASLNPIRYRGYYFDNETGFYYLQSRYYNPQIGRFLNADSAISGVGGSILGYNLFAYCFNNPVSLEDASGNWPQWIKNAANWVNDNIIQPVVNFFSPNTNTISGQFQDGILKGSGSLTAGYSESNNRFQINTKNDSSNGMLGVYSKTSVGNATGRIGVGNNDVTLSLKGVADGLSATMQTGLQYSNGLGLAAKAKASVISGRLQLNLICMVGKLKLDYLVTFFPQVLKL